MRPGQSETGAYTVDVIADSSGHWAGNGLRFDTADAAEAYAIDLWSRWTAVKEWRVVLNGAGGERQEVRHS